MKWSQVVSDQRFQDATIEDKLKIKESWYDSNIKVDPRYTPALDPQIRKDLFDETEPPKRSILQTAALLTPEDKEVRNAKARAAGRWATEQMKDIKRPPGLKEPSPLVYPIEAYKQTFGRAFGGYHSLLAGKGLMEGLINPTQQPSPVESVINFDFATKMGVPKTDVIGQTMVNGLAGWTLDLVGIQLIFGTVPKISKVIRGKYTGAQSKAVEGFKSALRSEIETAGISKKASASLADDLFYKQWVKTGILKRTPGALRQSTAILNANKGKLGEFIKSKVAEASATAEASGYTPEVLKQIPQLIKQLPFEGARTSFGKLIEGQILAKDAIPLHPSEVIRDSLEKIYPSVSKGRVITPAEVEAKTALGKLLQAQMKVKEQVPLHPTSAGREALKAITGDVSIKRTVAGYNVKQVDVSLLPVRGVGTTKEYYDKITSSMKKEGVLKPIIIDKQGRVWDGVHRIDYAREIGIQTVPAITIDSSKFDEKDLSNLIAEVNKVSISSKVELTKPQQTKAERLNIIKESHKQWLASKKVVTPEELIQNPSAVDTVNAFPLDSDPKTRALAKEIKSEVIPQVVKDTSSQEPPEYTPGDYYHTTYQTPSGIKTTLLKGNDLNIIKANLKAGQTITDSSGTPISSILNTDAVSGRKAELNLTVLDDAITLMDGIKQERVAWWSYFAKKFGTPFMIGEKYPPFGKTYNAIRDSFDYDHELTLIGHEILDKSFIKSLPPASQQKVVDALMLGNIEARKIEPTELAEVFKFTYDEIKAFKNIRRLLAFDTKITVTKRKLVSSYDKLDPKEKADADNVIKSEVDKIPGYMPHSRTGGNWAVYVEAPNPTDTNYPYFFDLYPNQLAAKDAAIKEGGSISNVYLRTKLKPDIRGRMTITDLEFLADSAGVDPNSTDLQDILKVIKERSFSSHWIKRKNIPKSAWNMDSVLKSVINYHHGAATGLSRAKGRIDATKVFTDNMSKMTPELRKYTDDFIKGVFDTGNIGLPTLQRFMFLWEIALKPKQLGQNATQVWANTFPAMLKYYNLPDATKNITKSYSLASRYAMFKIDGKRHGLSTELFGYLKKLDRQGKLGEQMTKYLLDSSDLRANFDKATSATMRLGEFINRTTTYISARFAGIEKLNLKSRDELLAFGKSISGRTQFDYAKYNLPTLITGAGNLRDFIKTMYIFRHFQFSNLGRIMQMTPWRGAKFREYTVGIGNALAMHGWRGLPFVGILALAYKRIMGRTLEHDSMEAMQEAGIPGKAIDTLTFGAPALADVDVSRLIGMGDVFPTYGDAMEKLMGASYGEYTRALRAWGYLQRGDKLRALELVSPGILRDMQRGLRYMREGVRKANGTLIATPSVIDSIKTMSGFNPLAISKAWLAEENIRAVMQKKRERTSHYYQSLATARRKGDDAEVKRLKDGKREYNKRVPKEQRIDAKMAGEARHSRLQQGRRLDIPRRLQKYYKATKEVFGVKK